MSLKVPKVGPDQAHSCPGELMIGPDKNPTFFTKKSGLVRKKSYLGRFWAPIWSGFLIGPSLLLSGVLVTVTVIASAGAPLVVDSPVLSERDRDEGGDVSKGITVGIRPDGNWITDLLSRPARSQLTNGQRATS